MEAEHPKPPAEAARLATNLGAELGLEPITRRELDARFGELKTRIWIVAVGGFIGSFAGGFLKSGITPGQAAETIWRML